MTLILFFEKNVIKINSTFFITKLINKKKKKNLKFKLLFKKNQKIFLLPIVQKFDLPHIFLHLSINFVVYKFKKRTPVNRSVPSKIPKFPITFGSPKIPLPTIVFITFKILYNLIFKNRMKKKINKTKYFYKKEFKPNNIHKKYIISYFKVFLIKKFILKKKN